MCESNLMALERSERSHPPSKAAATTATTTTINNCLATYSEFKYNQYNITQLLDGCV